MASGDEFVGGSYVHVRQNRSDESHVVVPIPALVDFLTHLQNQKGSPLTEEEVIAGRDSAACISMDAKDWAQLAEQRGFADIDAENVWLEWQAVQAAANEEHDQELESETRSRHNAGPPRWLFIAIAIKMALAVAIVAAVVWWANR